MCEMTSTFHVRNLTACI